MLSKIQKENSISALSKEQLKEIEKFNKKVEELNKFMEKNDLGFMIKHQVVIVPQNKNVKVDKK